MAVKRQQITVLYCKACVHSKAYKVPSTLCGKRQVINQMSHRGQTYRVYNRSSVVVKRSSIQSVIALPGRTTLASRARKLRPGILTHESIDRKRNTELYEVLLYCITVCYGLHSSFISVPHCSRGRRMGRRCPGNGDPLGSNRAPHQAVRGVVVKLCSMTLPDNRSSMRAALYGMTF